MGVNETSVYSAIKRIKFYASQRDLVKSVGDEKISRVSYKYLSVLAVNKITYTVLLMKICTELSKLSKNDLL